jgi:molybdopterin-binding protein
MRMSTRNQLPGTVDAVEHGGVMSTVRVTLTGGDTIRGLHTGRCAHHLNPPQRSVSPPFTVAITR